MFSEQTTILVKKNLLEDLVKWTGIDTSEFDIDFSKALGEGGGVQYNDEFLECVSEINILDKNKKCIGDGWIDHLVDQNNKLYSFWCYFYFKYGKTEARNKSHEIPDHLWNILDEETRNYLAKTHQGWQRDKKLAPYRLKYYPYELKEYTSKLRTLFLR